MLVWKHSLPLFYESTATLFDFAREALVFTDHQMIEAAEERYAQITDYYEARTQDKNTGGEFANPAYHPLAPAQLYLSAEMLTTHLSNFPTRNLSPFAPPDNTRAFDFGARQGRTFAAERSAGNINVFNAVRDHIQTLQAAGKQVIIAGWSDGSAERMAGVLQDHEVNAVIARDPWRKLLGRQGPEVPVITLGVETGFATDAFVIIAEQDILGDRLVRRGKRKRADNFLTEASSLCVSDLVVHVDHGVARYQGLKTLEVGGAPHDCLYLVYAGGDKLFLPVENIELLSRFGSDDPNAQLDRLGGTSWQLRKSKMRDRIRMMASELIKIAAKLGDEKG